MKKVNLKSGFGVYGNNYSKGVHIKFNTETLCGASSMGYNLAFYNDAEPSCSLCLKKYESMTAPKKKAVPKKTKLVKEMKAPVKLEKKTRPVKKTVETVPVVAKKKEISKPTEVELLQRRFGLSKAKAEKIAKTPEEKTMALAVVETKKTTTVKLPKEAYAGENLLKSTKGVTPADIKFVETYIAPAVIKHPDRNVVFNPLTRVTIETVPLINRLCAFVYDLSAGRLKKWGVPEGQMVQKYDRARYLILKLDRVVYSEIID